MLFAAVHMSAHGTKLTPHRDASVGQSIKPCLDRIHAWIEKGNPRAAAEVIRRIRERVGRLASSTLVHMGCPGLDEGTRELVAGPYTVLYELPGDRDEAVVLAVFHGAQDRERS